MNSSLSASRSRIAGVFIALALMVGISVSAAQPASAANAWTTCITPYQKAWNATASKPNVSDLIFHIGFANCSAAAAKTADAAGNFDLYYHHYQTWRVHYAQAASSGGKVAIEAWAALAKQGISKGLKGL